MYGLKEMLQKEKDYLEEILHQAERQLIGAPDGELNFSKCKNCVQYYHRTAESKTHKGKYISVKEKALVQRLAQKSFDEKLLKHVERRISQIDRILKDYEDFEIEHLYKKEHPERKKLIVPASPLWEDVYQSWLTEEYEGKEFHEDVPEIWTEKGERVRSKSEKILADYFYHKGIEYKYEKPLKLDGFGVCHPDFTFLSRRYGAEIYWEHEGCMDDPGYVNRNLRKIAAYERNGIFIGERLILTFETKENILDGRDIERKVKKYLL